MPPLARRQRRTKPKSRGCRVSGRGVSSHARLALALALSALLLAPAARADPQTHVAWRTAACGAGSNGDVWQETRWCNGITADLLLLRERNRDFGLGPYVELTTAGFFDVRFGGGATLLLPVSENYPLLVSLGAYDHALRAPALGATLFWGARSYNFDSAYNYAFGLYLSAQRDLADPRETLVSAGLEVDGFFLAAPFLLMAGVLK